MPLLNYTTQVSPDKTVAEIQQCLAKHGASAILNEYDNEGYIVALSFKMRVEKRDIGFKLPSDWRPILEVMKQDPKIPERFCNQEQALKVSWRIVKRWIEAQMAILETKMVKMEQIFLPYAITRSGKTLGEEFVISGNKLLGSGEK